MKYKVYVKNIDIYIIYANVSSLNCQCQLSLNF